MTRIIRDVLRMENREPVAVDFHLPPLGKSPLPVIVFVHGFKGFKDWGHWPLVAEHLSRAGFAVVRFNFSHNGTSPENQVEFVRPDLFGKNTFSKELDDVSLVIDSLSWHVGHDSVFDPSRLGLLGHSRGGGIALLAAAQDKRVKAVATWAGVSDFEPRVNPPETEKWKREGVRFVENTRTGQQLPVNYSFREDFYANRNRLDIKRSVAGMEVPMLVVHGTADRTVPFREAEQLHSWNMFSRFVAVEEGDHTFGGRHPWESRELPALTVKALQPTIAFFRENL
ncbi:MAG TPA: alpha/beta fold hydrolase [Bacteroidia bacterium]|nr:alpha/beta fold hydrolase [Bacteroidia bacterium]